MTPTTDARRRLREADPAAALRPAGAQELERIAHDARRVTDPVDVELPEARRRRAPAVLAACAVVLALAATIGVLAAQSGHHTQQAVHRSTPSRHTALPNTRAPISRATLPSPTTYPDHAAALRQVHAAIATLTVVPHAQQQDGPPTDVLEHAYFMEGSGKLIDHSRFWTAPGTVRSTIAYLANHPPARTRKDNPGQRGTVQFSSSPPRAGRIVVGYRAVPYAGGVAIRADVQNSWFPTKTAAQTIGTVTSVDIVMHRKSRLDSGFHPFPTIERTLVGARAQTLANAVDVSPLGQSGALCPLSMEQFTDRLVFHSGSRTITVIDVDNDCGSFVLQADAHSSVSLLGGIDPQLFKALGLPPDYGR